MKNKTTALDILMSRVGENNVRIENSNIYVYSKQHNAYVFFKTKLSLAAYSYDAELGWQDLFQAIDELDD
jgi:hypothetical protein